MAQEESERLGMGSGARLNRAREARRGISEGGNARDANGQQSVVNTRKNQTLAIFRHFYARARAQACLYVGPPMSSTIQRGLSLPPSIGKHDYKSSNLRDRLSPPKRDLNKGPSPTRIYSPGRDGRSYHVLCRKPFSHDRGSSLSRSPIRRR
ncbi:hypothetical protein KSP40_PGU005601 [Platanthera guangdongensis]|uniref:Uncharacterized protein n=1 Tax=Platanthera guangdongensis TaxID=2320717 RepID=A0ABR2MRS5_9ASPA